MTFPQRTLVINTNISHGPVLDRQIAALPAKNMQIRTSPAHEDGLIKVFNRQRADYPFLFPQQYVENKNRINVARSYPLAGIPNYIQGHFLCSNTKQMREVITIINQVLNQRYADNSLFKIHSARIRASDRPDFARYYQQAFVVE